MEIHLLITLIGLIGSCFMVYKLFKKCENTFEKTFYIFFVVVETFLIILYYLDRYNIPTLLSWHINVDTQKWLSILSDLGASLLTEILGGIILIWITLAQLNKTFENNRNRDLKERIINNMPFLEYKAFYDFTDLSDPIFVVPTIFNKDKAKPHMIKLEIKNIGMNTVKKCRLQIQGSMLVDFPCFEIAQQSSINKGDTKNVALELNLINDQYFLMFTVCYQDLLNSWYEQKINLMIEIDEKGSLITTHFDVEDSKEIKEPLNLTSDYDMRKKYGGDNG